MSALTRRLITGSGSDGPSSGVFHVGDVTATYTSLTDFNISAPLPISTTAQNGDLFVLFLAVGAGESSTESFTWKGQTVTNLKTVTVRETDGSFFDPEYYNTYSLVYGVYDSTKQDPYVDRDDNTDAAVNISVGASVFRNLTPTGSALSATSFVRDSASVNPASLSSSGVARLWMTAAFGFTTYAANPSGVSNPTGYSSGAFAFENGPSVPTGSAVSLAYKTQSLTSDDPDSVTFQGISNGAMENITAVTFAIKG